MKRINKSYLKETFPEFYQLLSEDEANQKEDCEFFMENGAKIMFQTYETMEKVDRRYETHEKFIDIQFIIEGEEIITIAPKEALTVDEPYDDKTDVAFYDGSTEADNEVVRSGEGLIIWPEDGHQPGVDSVAGVHKTNRKLMIKVPVNSELAERL